MDTPEVSTPENAQEPDKSDQNNKATFEGLFVDGTMLQFLTGSNYQPFHTIFQHL